MADDFAFTQVLLDFDNFVAWLFRSDRVIEISDNIMTMLNKEMNRRLQLSNANDPSTERWALFMRFAQDHIFTVSDTEVSQTETQAIEDPPTLIQTTRRVPPQLASLNVEILAQRTMGLVNENISSALTLHFQMDIVLIVRNITTRARILTDSLELLFQLILRKANSVPVHALLFIAAFYDMMGHKDKALLVVQTALKKIEGTDTELEFEILDRLGEWYLDHRIYDQAIIYYEREITGRTRRFGEMNGSIIHAKFQLGFALFKSGRVQEAEAVFLSCGTIAGLHR
jgi:tetratricopeptide (TPR) repeat protein